MLPVCLIGLLNLSRIQFRGFSACRTFARVIEIAAHRHIHDTAEGTSRIGAIVIFLYVYGCGVHVRIDSVARSRKQNNLDHTIARVQRIIEPADVRLSAGIPTFCQTLAMKFWIIYVRDRAWWPSEDAVESWASLSHGSRRLAVVVSARGRVDDASGDAQCHDASRRDRDVKGPVARRIARRRRERQEHRSETPDGERVAGSGSMSSPFKTAMRALS